jgi:hypothetical protein
MTFLFFFIIAHIEIYFIVRITFLNVVHYKNSQHKVKSLIFGHQSSKTHTEDLDALSRLVCSQIFSY